MNTWGSRVATSCVLGHLVFTLILSSSSAHAQVTNAWTNSASGHWQDPSWSLGVLPNASQTVAIANAGSKTVSIDATTAINFPSSLTVSNLLVTGIGPAGTTNTLLLSNAATNVPLHVLDTLSIGQGGAVQAYFSSLLANGAVITSGQFIQNGGLVSVTNNIFVDQEAHYYLTNGTLSAASLSLGFNYGYDGYFDQVGGSVQLNALTVANNNVGSIYHMQGGNLAVRDTINIGNSLGGDQFIQDGGTNRTRTLDVSSGSGPSTYTLNGGWLGTSNVLVGANQRGEFVQVGGTHIVTNTLSIQGTGSGFTPRPAIYSANNATLTARSILVEASHLSLTQSVVSVSESLTLKGFQDFFISSVVLNGGSLSCSNVVYADTGADISQTSGALTVSNLFSFGGRIATGFTPRFAQYTFSGGTLVASNIELTADWIIGSSAVTGRITNPGTFKMAGTLQVGDATEQLGRFILASNSVINLGDGNARLTFAGSRTETWTSNATLSVLQWNGSTHGGGNDQLRFGKNPSGLTSAQVNQIKFINPIGLSAGVYSAQLLNLGEVVPSLVGWLFLASGTNQIALQWTGSYTLQTATNLIGPYLDLVGATSPYTNTFDAPQRFFRLRQ